MLPSRHGNGAPAPSQSGLGEFELSNAITAPDICGTIPMNAADLCCCVVPVLPAIGRFQPDLPGRARRGATRLRRPCSWP